MLAMTMFSLSLHFIIYFCVLRRNADKNKERKKENQRNEIVKDNKNILLTPTTSATATGTATATTYHQKAQRRKVGNAYCVEALP